MGKDYRGNTINIAIFSSHNGTDLQAIIDACKDGKLSACVAAVISNNENSTALERAKREGISNYHISVKKYGNEDAVNEKIMEILNFHKIGIIFLAGYLKKISSDVLKKYENRIFNIHLALLPKYGGKGMYGINIHQAEINAGEAETGITVHKVSNEYDEGEIVARTKIPVNKTDTAESLAARILEREHVFIVEALKNIILNETT